MSYQLEIKFGILLFRFYVYHCCLVQACGMVLLLCNTDYMYVNCIASRSKTLHHLFYEKLITKYGKNFDDFHIDFKFSLQ